jgi:hypothetical protein
VDTRDLVDLAVVMEEMKLGPNGGVLYCLECAMLLAASSERFPSTIAWLRAHCGGPDWTRCG